MLRSSNIIRRNWREETTHRARERQREGEGGIRSGWRDRRISYMWNKQIAMGLRSSCARRRMLRQNNFVCCRERTSKNDDDRVIRQAGEKKRKRWVLRDVCLSRSSSTFAFASLSSPFARWIVEKKIYRQTSSLSLGRLYTCHRFLLAKTRKKTGNDMNTDSKWSVKAELIYYSNLFVMLFDSLT